MRKRPLGTWLGVLALLLLVAMTAGVAMGSVNVPPLVVWRIVLHEVFGVSSMTDSSVQQHQIVWFVRAPRLSRKATRPRSCMAEAPSPELVQWPVHISMATRLSGLSARMIRHYESQGLLPGIARSESGYRLYDENDIHALRFIQRGRSLGFDMEQLTELLGLWRDQGRSSAQVRQLAQRHADALAQRIADMQAMQQTLQTLIHACHGDERPDCPILDSLEGQACGQGRTA